MKHMKLRTLCLLLVVATMFSVTAMAADELEVPVAVATEDTASEEGTDNIQMKLTPEEVAIEMGWDLDACHTVFAVSTPGGAVQPLVQLCPEGTGVMVSLTAERGYRLAGCAVVSETGSSIDCHFSHDGLLHFSMPDESVTVTAVFDAMAHDEYMPCRFYGDINKSAWYHEAVDEMLIRSLVHPVADDRFGPDTSFTRGEVVELLWALDGRPDILAPVFFEDADAGSKYGTAAAWARENGIAYGFDGVHFGPNQTVTREEFAAMLYRYAVLHEIRADVQGDLSYYDDYTDIHDWALAAMSWVRGNALMTGRAETVMAPGGNVTRAEASMVTYRLLCITEYVDRVRGFIEAPLKA